MTAPGGAPAARDAEPRACPSAPAAPGATLLGFLGPDGRISNLRTTLTVDTDFLEEASRHGPPESRMRFAARCQTSGCTQWTGTRCGVIDRALAHLAALGEEPGTDLPPCTIRATCRWFGQVGATACGACSLIVTDTRDAVAAE
ncbi:hypothetical protein RNZ50_06080 [Paracoccaceae bacterium Fryx2]|nr:hypothetical protein [Paracoccaceae bacterium Fryx2]